MSKQPKRGTCKHCGERISYRGGYWRTAAGEDDAGYVDGKGGDASCRQRPSKNSVNLPHEQWAPIEMKRAREERRRIKAATAKAMIGQTDAVRFFVEHGGYAWHKERETLVQAMRRGAMELARAEAERERRGWRVGWEADEHLHEADCCDATEAECAVLYDAEGRVLASLGSVCGADAGGYRRVVEAELASEALGDIEQQAANEHTTDTMVARHFAL